MEIELPGGDGEIARVAQRRRLAVPAPVPVYKYSYTMPFLTKIDDSGDYKSCTELLSEGYCASSTPAAINATLNDVNFPDINAFGACVGCLSRNNHDATRIYSLAQGGGLLPHEWMGFLWTLLVLGFYMVLSTTFCSKWFIKTLTTVRMKDMNHWMKDYIDPETG